MNFTLLSLAGDSPTQTTEVSKLCGISSPVKTGISSSVNINDAITHACCLTAKDLNAAAITTTTLSGHTARMISRFHPACPIAALTTREKVRRQMNLYWGVQPYLTGEITSTDRIFSLCSEMAVKEGIAKGGDTIVVTAGVPLGQAVETNLIKAHVINDESL